VTVVAPSAGWGELAASSTLDEHAFGKAAGEIAPSFAPQPLGIRRRALGGDVEALRAVGAQHFAQEPEPLSLETGEARDRRPARALELGQEGALGRQRCGCLAVGDRVQRLEHTRVATTRGDRDRALAWGGQELVNVEHRASAMREASLAWALEAAAVASISRDTSRPNNRASG